MAKTYARVVGILLLVVGILGFLVGSEIHFLGLLYFEPVHNLVHLITGLIGVWVGFKGGDKAVRQFAWIFGVIYTLLALAGFAGLTGIGEALGMMHVMDGAYNVIHLIVGLWGIYAATRSPAPVAAA